MNVNEIIANLALIKIGEKPGSYNLCDPIEQSNIFQSTNDVIPTALRVATIQLLEKLEEAINTLRSKIEEKEKSNRNAIRVGYTQMQEAVPSSFGLLFSSYADALSRDWWRVSKCFERIKVVNLGGGAIGTGMRNQIGAKSAKSSKRLMLHTSPNWCHYVSILFSTKWIWHVKLGKSFNHAWRQHYTFGLNELKQQDSNKDQKHLHPMKPLRFPFPMRVHQHQSVKNRCYTLVSFVQKHLKTLIKKGKQQ